MRSYMLYAEWHPGDKYKFEADSNAVTSVWESQYSHKKRIPVTPEEEFSSLFIRLILPDTAAIVQLMDNSDKVVRSAKAVNNRADFFYLKPGEYYLRLFIDRNNDGKWTTGDYTANRQPEEVFYFPKPLTLRALGSRTRLGRERHSIEQTEAGSHHQTKTGCRQNGQTT